MFHEGQAQICGSNRGKEMLEEKKINATPNYAVTIHFCHIDEPTPPYWPS